MSGCSRGAEGEAGAATAATGEGAALEEAHSAPGNAVAATAVDEAEPMDEDALLQQALAMSMAVDEPTANDSANGGANGSVPHTELVRRLSPSALID